MQFIHIHISLEAIHKDKGDWISGEGLVWESPTYILQFGQIHFTMWKNAIGSPDKYTSLKASHKDRGVGDDWKSGGAWDVMGKPQ